MTTTTHTCLTIACNVCGETFTDEDEGATPHFDTVQEARDYQDAWDADCRWTIRDDGYAICPVDDEEFSHDLARAALAAEPEPQISGQTEIAVPRGFRIGDVVEITAREGESEATPPGLRLNGKTGVVTELDDNPEYPIGLSVEGWLGLVWCNSGEVRHVEPGASEPVVHAEELDEHGHPTGYALCDQGGAEIAPVGASLANNAWRVNCDACLNWHDREQSAVTAR